ncbi:MAG: signal peptidase II [Frankia sp.]
MFGRSASDDAHAHGSAVAANGAADAAADGADGGAAKSSGGWEPDPAAVRPRSRRAVALLVVAAAGVLAADVVSKILAVEHLSNRGPVTVVPHVLDLELTRNPGAAFSMAGGATILFSLVAVVVVVVIARTARGLRSRAWAVVLGLLLGGALGNLSDRIFRAPAPLRGHVVDWIHLHHWPVFNLADSSIVVGAVVAVILSAVGIGIDGRRAAIRSPAADQRPAGAAEPARPSGPGQGSREAVDPTDATDGDGGT